MDELEKLYEIPQNKSPKVYIRYYSSIKKNLSTNNPSFNLQTFNKNFNDFMENYWLKYHQEDESNLRIILAKVANCKVEELPLKLIINIDESGQKMFGKGLFHNRIRNEPQFEYYYSVIFNPYYQKIKSALLDIEPLFGALDEKFLKAMVVHHLEGHQDDYYILRKKYKQGLPCFYERVIYFGFNVLYQNDEYLHVKVNNEEQRVVLSQIYMNFKNKAA